ncbi:endonuclease/exonuclease/phosphatase family protein [Tsuneonella sp. YG55]|uniref:Endonuclease/exonuclease/phosphatase family protein n=1 Tax=Tsuneonella litorea TaxID=2976475 RepID=A0A9X3A8S8_9SPHN|nr:endonuclease/exonuclease/phosphatase family protein [Tsuneonella litorea]MCT2558120.1 endonuclease/exonuclease/phosphatase family protein [Tsuneonella litorea]
MVRRVGALSTGRGGRGRLILIAAAPLAVVAFLGLPDGSYPGPHDRLWEGEPGSSAPVEQMSVLSYNVEGLPPPARWGRKRYLSRIAEELATMRRAGKAPQVVVLQEAFSDPSPPIAAIAGYRYTASGPTTADRSAPSTAEARTLARGARLTKGEGIGHWLGSGLRIMSDFPIVSVRRMAFPAWMCAGYDCLASKGVLIAWIAVPGSPQSVAFIDAHLNSMRLVGVPSGRSDQAYALQVAAMRAFVAENVPPGAPAVFAGDFDTENALRRRLLGDPPLAGARSAIPAAIAADDAIAPGDRREAAAILSHGVDRLYYRGSPDWPITLDGLSVPFGLRSDGTMLSDHRGFVVRFAVGRQRAS